MIFHIHTIIFDFHIHTTHSLWFYIYKQHILFDLSHRHKLSLIFTYTQHILCFDCTYTHNTFSLILHIHTTHSLWSFTYRHIQKTHLPQQHNWPANVSERFKKFHVDFNKKRMKNSCHFNIYFNESYQQIVLSEDRCRFTHT